MGFSLIAYVDWLVENNKQQHPTLELMAHSFCYGLLEEISELYLAETNEQKILEAGDVLAYSVLILFTLLNYNTEEIADILKPADYCRRPALSEVLHRHQQELAGIFKRLERGDYSIEDIREKLRDTVRDLVISAISYCFSSLDVVASSNKAKLYERLNKTNTFKGEGDR